jgi:hypothetical protein
MILLLFLLNQTIEHAKQITQNIWKDFQTKHIDEELGTFIYSFICFFYYSSNKRVTNK